MVGVLLTIAGSSIVAFSDTHRARKRPLLGDSLALAGALAVSATSRRPLLRHRLSLLPYIWLVYTTAAVVLLIWMALAVRHCSALTGRLSPSARLAIVPASRSYGVHWALRTVGDDRDHRHSRRTDRLGVMALVILASRADTATRWRRRAAGRNRRRTTAERRTRGRACRDDEASSTRGRPDPSDRHDNPEAMTITHPTDSSPCRRHNLRDVAATQPPTAHTRWAWCTDRATSPAYSTDRKRIARWACTRCSTSARWRAAFGAQPPGRRFGRRTPIPSHEDGAHAWS